MSYDAKPIFFMEPVFSTPQIKEAMLAYLKKWLPKHSSSDDLNLYHYTTLEGLKGIINSRSIWLTNTSTLNDPLELIYGTQLILDILNEKTDIESEELVKELLNDLSAQVNAFNKFSYKFYVACFCESENLLSQWRGYASQGGGYNLGLRFQSETKFYHTFDDSKEESYIILRKMIYDVDEQRDLISNYISTIISSSYLALEYYKTHGGVPSPWPSVAAMECVNILFDLLLSFKSPVFKEENEWRLILGREASYKPEQLKFKETKTGLVPYIKTYIIEESGGKSTIPLCSIKFGPMLDEVSTKSALELYLNKEIVSNNEIKIEINNLQISGPGYALRR